MDAQLKQVSLALLLQFCAVSCFSLGAFTVPIETLRPSLTSIWSDAQALLNLIAAASMVLTGLLFDTSSPSSPSSSASSGTAIITKRLRRLTPLVALCYAPLVLAAPAITHASPWLLRLALLSHGVPAGMFFIMPIQLLVLWMPRRAAQAMSLNTLAIALSQVALAPLFAALVHALGVRAALVAVALSLAAATAALTAAVRLPTDAERAAMRLEPGPAPSAQPEKTAGSSSYSSRGNVESREHEHCMLPSKELMRLPAMGVFVIALVAARPVKTLLLYFFKLSFVLGVPHASAMVLFQLMSFLRLPFTVAANAAVQACQRRLSCGGRVALGAVLAVQGAMLATIVPLLWLSSAAVAQQQQLASSAALALVGALTLFLGVQNTCVVVAARECFGERNASVVIGVAGGLAFGLGDALWTWEMANVERMSLVHLTAQSYCLFFVLAAAGSILGILSVAGIGRSKEIFGEDALLDEKQKRACESTYGSLCPASNPANV